MSTVVPVSKEEIPRLIDAAGGSRAFVKLLGLDENMKSLRQLIYSWKNRGLPELLMYKHYDTIQRLRKEAARRERRATHATPA